MKHGFLQLNSFMLYRQYHVHKKLAQITAVEIYLEMRVLLGLHFIMDSTTAADGSLLAFFCCSSTVLFASSKVFPSGMNPL